MIKLYGVPASRALRSIWAIEETGVEYTHVPTSFLEDSKKDDYLAINPNGRIPAMVDGDLTLFESLAINLYLARKYGGDLHPESLEDQARSVQWSFWAITELEPHLIQMVVHTFVLPEAERQPALIAAAGEAVQKPLGILDRALADRTYLLGDVFTIADLNTAGVLGTASFVGFDFSKFKVVKRWFDACTARPAFARAQKVGS